MTQSHEYKQYDAAWKRVILCTSLWSRTLGMDGLTIKHRRVDAPPEDGELAATHPQWEYKQASIIWYMPKVAAIDDDELEAAVVHEFVHVLLAPMETWAREQKKCPTQAFEFAVESVTQAILKVAINHG